MFLAVTLGSFGATGAGFYGFEEIASRSATAFTATPPLSAVVIRSVSLRYLDFIISQRIGRYSLFAFSIKRARKSLSLHTRTIWLARSAGLFGSKNANASSVK